MRKMIVSALVFISVTVTGITGYAASSRAGQFVRPCASWCHAASECLAGTLFSDTAAFAGKRMLSYQKANVLEKKAATASASAKNDTAADADASINTDTASVNADAATTEMVSTESTAAPAQAAAVPAVADTTVVADQSLCPHGYCIGQGVCPYVDCPNGGYCYNNDGYQYQDSSQGYGYQGGYDQSAGQDYSYQGGYDQSYGQGYGYQGGCGYGQGYGCQGGYGNGSGHHGGRGHH